MENSDILALTNKRGEIAILTNEIEKLKAELGNCLTNHNNTKQTKQRRVSLAENLNNIKSFNSKNRSSSEPPEDKRSILEYGNEILVKFGIKPSNSLLNIFFPL